jgi:hypothetical protein
MKNRTIHGISDISELRTTVEAAAERAADALRERLSLAPALDVLAAVRFERIGWDPLEPDRPLNMIEQVNQTFTYLATCDALQWLFEHRATKAPFVVNLGTASGPDIVSEDGGLAAEVFAAVTPQNNNKLAKDIAKVTATAAPERYVFCACPDQPAATASAGSEPNLVNVVYLAMIRDPQQSAPSSRAWLPTPAGAMVSRRE